MSEINEGVKILIDRMRTHPEDFAPTYPGEGYLTRGSHYTWHHLATVVVEDKEVFTSEEKEAVAAALREVTRKNFTARILDLLAAPEEKIDETALQAYAFRESMKNSVIIGGTAMNTATGQTIKQRLQK